MGHPPFLQESTRPIQQIANLQQITIPRVLTSPNIGTGQYGDVLTRLIFERGQYRPNRKWLIFSHV